MENIWIVVPVTSNDVDLSDFIDKLCGKYVAPEKFLFEKINSQTKSFETVELDHPYFNIEAPTFENKIIFVNMIENYKKYDKVNHVESFGEINIPRLMNAGIEYAKKQNADKILVLSNPCNFDIFIINEAAQKMKNGEIINIADGAAFMLPGDTKITLNENLRIWYWAEDLYNKAKEKVSYYRSDFMAFSEIIPIIVNTEYYNSIVEQDEATYKIIMGNYLV